MLPFVIHALTEMSLHDMIAEIRPFVANLIAAAAVLGLVPETVLPLAQQFSHRG